MIPFAAQTQAAPEAVSAQSIRPNEVPSSVAA
jgi:hypothetical protein